MEIKFTEDFTLKPENKNATLCKQVLHGDIIAFSKEVAMKLLFEESIYDNFDLEIKGIEDGMLKIQFLEHGREIPQKGYTLKEFKEMGESGEFAKKLQDNPAPSIKGGKNNPPSTPKPKWNPVGRKL